ncbi:MAG TPA: Gfo/Idh/MocA family oxidoreductase [Oscillatoriales cyanobacterium M59_W2019_021]|nr:MAG: gfo/Idh/MocA family oxidoreductase [Cyanobacteria bacterium J055]HIK30189.1 Gfo/Idh/MocA family oxidoreductase [Oscillatoriales cyanobacterium M4454_W2019_049]HIK49568.1 Gfo/Idh/MocA family oxidoreductase [Oscillatoriales cyanobacterium M59_W2019_021]
MTIRVGIIGTGFAAHRRAEAFAGDKRSQLVAVAGSSRERVEELCQPYSAEVLIDWEELVRRDDIDLVTICTTNNLHGEIVRKALENCKHVVVEYPLSLDPTEAEELVAFAEMKGKLLHVEHIELLGGVHQAFIQRLPIISPAFYVHYVTISPKHPAPRKWSYQSDAFGFPLVGALSRLHRLIDRFGEVASVRGRAKFWDAPELGYYKACWCEAQLEFTSGVMGEVVYAKGEMFWQAENQLAIYGEKGTLILGSDGGILIDADGEKAIEVGGRRGLFAKDTTMVLDRLSEGKPLYLANSDSVYTLKVADAIRKAVMGNG